jgi:hypothetical protein
MKTLLIIPALGAIALYVLQTYRYIKNRDFELAFCTFIILFILILLLIILVLSK